MILMQKYQHENPSKFTCGFVVHPGFVRGACWEIERCVEELGHATFMFTNPLYGYYWNMALYF